MGQTFGRADLERDRLPRRPGLEWALAMRLVSGVGGRGWRIRPGAFLLGHLECPDLRLMGTTHPTVGAVCFLSDDDCPLELARA